MSTGELTAAYGVHRLDLGFFVRPASEVGPDATGPRAEPVLAYLVPLGSDGAADGWLLFDSGIGELDEETDAHYRPRRRALGDALAAIGVDAADVRLVVNCHLHIDHCGANRELPGRPIVVQRAELELARGPDHTLPWLVDFPGARYEEVSGEAEVAPGVVVVPTPGHTAGHQSLVVRPAGDRGGPALVLAGQATDFASEWGCGVLAAEAEGIDEPRPAYPPWTERLLAERPAHVAFAHDRAVWTP